MTREIGTENIGEWLESVDARLEGAAAHWADRTVEIRDILSDEGITKANEATKQRFIVLLKRKFSPEIFEDERTNEAEELKTLHQGKEETIHNYYRRTLDLFEALGGRDTPEISSMEPLGKAEQYLLSETIAKFIHGLSNFELRIKMMEYIAESNISLSGAYKKASINARVFELQRKAIEDMEEEKHAEKWAMFHKQLIAHRENVVAAALHAGLTYIDQGVEKPINISLQGRKFMGLQPERSVEFSNKRPELHHQWSGQDICDQYNGNLSPSPNYHIPIREINKRFSEQQRGNNISNATPFDHTKSSNPYVNGSKWFPWWIHRLCTKCGEVFPKDDKHTWWICDKPALSRGESDYLRTKLNSFRKDRFPSWGLSGANDRSQHPSPQRNLQGNPQRSLQRSHTFVDNHHTRPTIPPGQQPSFRSTHHCPRQRPST